MSRLLRFKVYVALLLTLSASLCHPASAQKLPASAKLPSTALSFGVLLPTNSDTAHRTGSTLLLGELRYALPASGPLAVSRTVFSGTAAISNRATEGSVLVSGTVGQVFSLRSGQSPLAGRTGYIGAGVGVYAMDLRFSHAVARFGGYAEAGYNLDRALFVDAQYHLVDRGSGASVALGTRF